MTSPTRIPKLVVVDDAGEKWYLESAKVKAEEMWFGRNRAALLRADGAWVVATCYEMIDDNELHQERIEDAVRISPLEALMWCHENGVEVPAELAKIRPGPPPQSCSRRSTTPQGRTLKKKWYTIEEAAEASGRSITTLRRDIKASVLQAHAIGSGQKRPTYRIHRSHLTKYIKAGRAEPACAPTRTIKAKPARKRKNLPCEAAGRHGFDSTLFDV